MKSIFFVMMLLPSLVFADGIATDAEAIDAAVNLGLECDGKKSVEHIPFQDAVYISVSCRMGAYNHFGILFRDDVYSPLQVIPLSSPYLGKDGKVAGWVSEVINPAVSWDAETQTLVSAMKGGITEHLVAKYKLHDGYVVLVRYSTYNMAENDDNPVEKVIYQAEGEF